MPLEIIKSHNFLHKKISKEFYKPNSNYSNIIKSNFNKVINTNKMNYNKNENIKIENTKDEIVMIVDKDDDKIKELSRKEMVTYNIIYILFSIEIK